MAEIALMYVKWRMRLVVVKEPYVKGTTKDRTRALMEVLKDLETRQIPAKGFIEDLRRRYKFSRFKFCLIFFVSPRYWSLSALCRATSNRIGTWLAAASTTTINLYSSFIERAARHRSLLLNQQHQQDGTRSTIGQESPPAWTEPKNRRKSSCQPTTLADFLQSGTTPSPLLLTSRSSLCRINTKQ